MVTPCSEIFQWSLDCEWSNLATMIIELIIAGIMAIIITWIVHSKQQKITHNQQLISNSLLLNQIKEIQNTIPKFESTFSVMNARDMLFSSINSLPDEFENIDERIHIVKNFLDFNEFEKRIILLKNSPLLINLKTKDKMFIDNFIRFVFTKISILNEKFDDLVFEKTLLNHEDMSSEVSVLFQTIVSEYNEINSNLDSFIVKLEQK